MSAKDAFIEKITEITERSYDDLKALQVNSGLSKHSEIRTMYMEKLGLTYGFANTLVHYVLGTDSESIHEFKTMDEVLDEIYTGPKEKFRAMHDLIMERIDELMFEIAPKKGYVSLINNKQFAMIGPKTNSRMEVGLNLAPSQAHDRLIEQKPGSMCKYIVKLTSIEEVDDQLIAWINQAYEQS